MSSKILDDLLKISHCSEKSELLYTSFCILSLLCLLLTIFWLLHWQGLTLLMIKEKCWFSCNIDMQGISWSQFGFIECFIQLKFPSTIVFINISQLKVSLAAIITLPWPMYLCGHLFVPCYLYADQNHHLLIESKIPIDIYLMHTSGLHICIFYFIFSNIVFFNFRKVLWVQLVFFWGGGPKKTIGYVKQ